MVNTKKIPISKRALIQRINRVLAKDDENLKATRGERWRGNLGDFYIIDLTRNAVIAQHCDLEDLGKELKVLKDWEALEVE